MTDTNYTHITLVLDRSGSMSSVRNDTIGGVNTFLAEQKKLTDKCTITLHQFDDQHEIVYSMVPITSAPPLTQETYVPRGMTALLDAIGTEIEATGARLSALPESLRPAKVLFVIMTDGEENASKILDHSEVPVPPQLQPPFAQVTAGLHTQARAHPRQLRYRNEKLAELIARQRDAYKWQFVFLGANQDAFTTAAAMNIGGSSTMSYAASAQGTASAFASVGKMASNYRRASGQSMGASFDAEDRQWQNAAGADNSKAPPPAAKGTTDL